MTPALPCEAGLSLLFLCFKLGLGGPVLRLQLSACTLGVSSMSITVLTRPCPAQPSQHSSNGLAFRRRKFCVNIKQSPGVLVPFLDAREKPFRNKPVWHWVGKEADDDEHY